MLRPGRPNDIFAQIFQRLRGGIDLVGVLASGKACNFAHIFFEPWRLGGEIDSTAFELDGFRGQPHVLIAAGIGLTALDNEYVFCLKLLDQRNSRLLVLDQDISWLVLTIEIDHGALQLRMSSAPPPTYTTTVLR